MGICLVARQCHPLPLLLYALGMHCHAEKGLLRMPLGEKQRGEDCGWGQHGSTGSVRCAVVKREIDCTFASISLPNRVSEVRWLVLVNGKKWLTLWKKAKKPWWSFLDNQVETALSF